MVATLSANEILRMKSPAELFTRADKDIIKNEYRELAKKWHPDLNGNSKESVDVTSKLNVLYENGIEMVDAGKWEIPGVIKLTDNKGKIHQIRYRVCHEFELGDMYIGDKVLVYVIKNENKEFYDNALSMTREFKYSSDKMKEEMSRFLPKILDKFEVDDGRYALVLEKTSDQFLLKDLLEYYKGEIPDKHVAWMMSGLYNICCYLDYAGLSHNGVTVDNIFVSPQYHSSSLLGGWWYCVSQKDKMIGVSAETYSIMPKTIKDNKKGSIKTDLESVRLIGRTLLGNKSGALLKGKSIPDAFVDWVRGVGSDKAVEDYKGWIKCLENSYGKRKFVVLDVNSDVLYNVVNK